MITNNYNIPNIPCKDRVSESDTTDSDRTLRCSGLNPDNVFGTLFPNRANPVGNYAIYEKKK